jgi:hypothetical protein
MSESRHDEWLQCRARIQRNGSEMASDHALDILRERHDGKENEVVHEMVSELHGNIGWASNLVGTLPDGYDFLGALALFLSSPAQDHRQIVAFSRVRVTPRRPQ